MPTDHPRSTVVIGASKGLGRHLALRAVARGDRVLAAARGADDLARLEAEADGAIEVLAGDLLAPGRHLDEVASWLAAGQAAATVIISAATLGPVGALARVDMAVWAAAIEANVVGTARILAALVPRLDGSDVVLTFAGGGIGGPTPQAHVSSYTVSKTALLHLVEVVATEHPDGPTVVAVAPGAYPTDFTAAVRTADPALAGEALLADVARTAALPFDTSDLDAMVDHLEGGARWLSGRTVSARRDRPDTLIEREAPDDRDLYRLRRVDGEFVTARSW